MHPVEYRWRVEFLVLSGGLWGGWRVGGVEAEGVDRLSGWWFGGRSGLARCRTSPDYPPPRLTTDQPYDDARSAAQRLAGSARAPTSVLHQQQTTDCPAARHRPATATCYSGTWPVGGRAPPHCRRQPWRCTLNLKNGYFSGHLDVIPCNSVYSFYSDFCATNDVLRSFVTF